MSTRKQLKSLVEARRGLLVPGAFNALSAKVIEDLGFEAIYITGAGVTNMWFGMPDQGFMGLAEIADHTARIRDAVSVPLIVDADTGFGNALNVHHTVRTLERAGADCIQFEDQVAPKRCGHFSGKAVISTEEAVSKAEEIRALPLRLAKPQLANMVIGGKTPIFNAKELGELGYGIVLYANAALQGALAGMNKALTVLRDEMEVQESSGLVTPFAERQRLVNKPFWDALEKRYSE